MTHPSTGLIFDIGMYDGTDTAYYLESGFSVVAIEANPALATSARTRFSSHVDSGKLTIVNAALSERTGDILELSIPTSDLGSTSAIPEKLSTRSIAASFKIETIGLSDLFSRFGLPCFLKADIEGLDRHCVLPLTPESRPEFLSFEAGPDHPELIDHLEAIGFRRFRAINQCNFLPLQKQKSLRHRLHLCALHLLGFRDPMFIRHNGRFFRVEHGSGPPSVDARREMAFGRVSAFRLEIFREAG